MKSKPFQTEVKALGGKAAIFVRGFGEYMLAKAEKGVYKATLRQAQDAGLSAVTSRGDSISIPYISQLSGRLEKEGFYSKQRVGKSFNIVFDDDQLDKMEALLDGDYGTEALARELTVEDLKHRTAVIRHIEEHEGVVIRHDNPVPKAAYKVLLDRFNKGELIMGFFDKNEYEGLAPDFPEYVSVAKRTK